MGYPVAYRRSAPVRNVGGSQGRSYGRQQNASSRANARTPVQPKPYEVPVPSPQQIARDALGFLGLPGKIAGLLLDLWDLSQSASAPGNAAYNIPGNWATCPTPSSMPCIGYAPTHYVNSGFDNSCNFVGACTPNLTLGGVQSLPVVGNYRRVTFITLEGSTLGRWTVTKQLVRTDAVNTVPQYETSPPPMWPDEDLPPDLGPSFDYMFMPIGRPVGAFPPLPYWVVPYRNPWGDPGRPPTEQPQRGPLPADRPRIKPETYPGVAPGAQGKAGPSFIVGPTSIATLAPPTHQQFPRPPKRGTKERKFVMAVDGVLGQITHIVTESRDFIKAVWEALPKRLRSKGKVSVQQMLKDIWDHLDDLDLLKAVGGIVENELKDRLYGKAGRLAAQGKRNAFNTGYDRGTAGYQLGTRYRPRVSGQGEYKLPDWKDALPSYTYRDMVKAVRRE